MINTAEVLNKVGELIAADSTLAKICVSTFGRGCQVAVSGYSQKLMGETDAPFVMVFPDEDEMDADQKEITNFVAKVVIGFCPVKDLPNAAALVDIASGIVTNFKEAVEEAPAFIEQYATGDEQRTRAEEFLDFAKSAMDNRIGVIFSSLNAGYKGGDIDTVLGKAEELRIAVFESSDAMRALSDIHGILRPGEQISDDTTFGVALVAMNDALPQLVSEANAIRAKWEDFNENPFIADTRSVRTEKSNGLIVFGSLNILDNFRNCINRILNDNDFGLPVTKVTMKNNSSSHYPLEWAEITITFNNHETLNPPKEWEL